MNLRTVRRYFVEASVLLALHGLIEVLGIFNLFGIPEPGVPAIYQSFAFQELVKSWQAVSGIGIVSGILRILAAVGLLRHREWGWWLGLLMSAITFSMLTFYLPFGLVDAILAGGVLALLLVGRFGKTPIAGL